MKRSVITLRNFFDELTKNQKTMVGYPGNMDKNFTEFNFDFFNFLINNAGDPQSIGAYNMHSKKFEQDVLDYFARLHNAPNDYWGYITNGSTESNDMGIIMGREYFEKDGEDVALYYSADTHYSIGKAAHIYGIKEEYQNIVNSKPNGEINYNDFERRIQKERNPILVCLNIGTTVKGAIDDVKRVKSILDKHEKKHYIHLDSALLGGILPHALEENIVDFDFGFDSLSVSTHKFYGVPFPSSIFLSKKKRLSKYTPPVNYIDSADSTISGSRNGHAAIFLWHLLMIKKDSGQLKKEAKMCLENAQYLKQKLKELGYKPTLNKNSNIVFFKAPKKELIKKWQLSTVENNQFAHIVVMPHVTKKLINSIIIDFSE